MLRTLATGAGVYSSETATRPALDVDPDATLIDDQPAARVRHDPATGPFSPGQPFGARYHIVRLLGIGGMGAVYQAWDAELGVIVALKVIRPEVAADPTAAAMLERRFKQELLLARKVTHKNVVRIHELGEIDGIKFITMPFVEGEELATIIRRQDKLPIERIMKIARGLATGLEAAHAAGVVHRDLKPANIMVDKNDDAMIMDFGIARSTGGRGGADRCASGAATDGLGRRPDDGRRGRRHSPIHGTRASARAAGGSPCRHLCVRLDCVRHAAQSVAWARRRHRARRVDTAHAGGASAPRSVDPTISEPLDKIVRKCIEPDVAQRFQSTSQLVAALARLDDRGRLLPVARRVTRRLVAAVGLAFITLSA